MDLSDEDWDYVIKLILIGDSWVGKTSLLGRFNNPATDYVLKTHTTIGYDFSTKFFEQDDKIIQVHLWDTTGQEKYKSLVKTYYKRAMAAIWVYDITKYETFENAERWISDLRENGENNAEVIVVGNKVDLKEKRMVSEEEGKEFAKKHRALFIEASASTGKNVKTIFDYILNRVIDSIKEHEKI